MKVMATFAPASTGVFLDRDDVAPSAVWQLAPFIVTPNRQLPADVWFCLSDARASFFCEMMKRAATTASEVRFVQEDTTTVDYARLALAIVVFFSPLL